MGKSKSIIVGVTLLTLLPAIPFYAGNSASAADFGDTAFRKVWTRTDALVANNTVKRSFYWGPTPGESLMEPYAQGKGGMRLVQYYDKSRMEINNPAGNQNDPFYVTNGLLTVELVSGKMQVGDTQYQDAQPANIPLASDNDDANAPTYASFTKLANTTLGDHPAADMTGQVMDNRVDKAGNVTKDTSFDKYAVKAAFYNAETKHNIADQIWTFLNTSGPVIGSNGQQTTAKLSDPWFYTTGYAISEPYWANVKIAGKQTQVLVQLFQRRVVTYQPDAPAGFKVQMGNIGAHYYDWRYKSGSSAQQPLPVFASYNLELTTVTPRLAPYTVSANLSNVSNIKSFQMSASAKTLLAQNDFVAMFPQGDQYKQFYQLYEEGRYDQTPVFVSTDSMLNVYHQLFDKLLRNTETKYLISDLRNLDNAMLTASQNQYNTLKGTNSEVSAKRNLAFFAVAAKLIDPNAAVPTDVQSLVSQEISLINAHQGQASSPVMSIGGNDYSEDYSQYVPRGHYTLSDDLKHYFQAMMWYGRLTFRLKYPDETRSALLLTEALQSGNNGKLWSTIYDPTSFFVGGSDDLTYLDYAPLLAQAFGPNATAQALTDDAKLAQFQNLAKSLAAPRINSMFVYIDQDVQNETKGLRVMGQRFTVDEYVLGQLLYRNVGDPSPTAPDSAKRWMPKALDVTAAFGSQTAYNILNTQGDTKFLNYNSQLTKVQTELNSLPSSQWTQNLYWSWLYSFKPLLQAKAANSGYPSFMTNDAWNRKDLNTVLGSYTELKHDTILYAKQVMAEMGGGPADIIKGYVEPEPEFYARLAALIGMTRDGLMSRGLIEKPADQYTEDDYNTLTQMYNLALDFKHISEKELANQALTDDEYTEIQYFGGTLEHITMEAADTGDPSQGRTDINDQDAAVVADIATGGPQLNQALEEGTGRIMEIYVVAPIGGKLVLTRGGIYSQYEFTEPSSNRLTDDQWRTMLNSNKAPAIGDWKTFISK